MSLTRAWDFNYYVENLKKAERRGFDLAWTLVVDDTPKKLERNYGNAIYIRPYFSDPTDRELQRLSVYLKSFHRVEDFRRIEKSG